MPKKLGASQVIKLPASIYICIFVSVSASLPPRESVSPRNVYLYAATVDVRGIQLLSYMPIGSCFPFGHINFAALHTLQHKVLAQILFSSWKKISNQMGFLFFWSWKFNESRVLLSFFCIHACYWHKTSWQDILFPTFPVRSFNVVAYDAKLLLIRLIFILFLCVNIFQLAVGTWRYILTRWWEYLFG